MRSFKEYLAREPEKRKRVVDEKTLFFLFQKEIKNRYGERGLQMILPLSFHGQTLGVKTKSPLWANELWLEREAILHSLNTSLGDEVVKSLKLYTS